MYTLSLYNLLRKIPAGYHHQWPFFILQQQYLNKLLPVSVIAGTQVYIHSANVLHRNLINTTCHMKVLWIEIHCCTCLIHITPTQIHVNDVSQVQVQGFEKTAAWLTPKIQQNWQLFQLCTIVHVYGYRARGKENYC